MNSNFDGGPSDPSDEPPPRISKANLKRDGWQEVRAFVPPKEQSPLKHCEKKDARSDAARKAAQRKRQLEDGLKQINVVAPMDDDARALVMEVAEKIKSKPVRRDIRAVLADGELLMIGRRVRRLRGEAAIQVRTLLNL